ncbi:MAG: DUF4258 domain-containing protein [Campylobacterales bacterium]|nr:DUF4258 domain-containing protein [Campylobacterales bacterium]
MLERYSGVLMHLSECCKEVKDAILYGEIIEQYRADTPFESVLILYHGDKAIHTVVSLDKVKSIIYVITAYEPDTIHFENDLKTRR